MASAVLGGTFNMLHKGHEGLFEQAAKFSQITIGLTSEKYARKLRIYPCLPYKTRLANLKAMLGKLGILEKAKIVPLGSRFGPAAKNKFDCIITSHETEHIAHRINKAREKKGLGKMKVISVPILRAQDGIKISCTRIENGKITSGGKRKKPLVIAIGTKNKCKISGVRSAAKKAWNFKCIIKSKKVDTGIPEQPIGFSQIYKGASRRARQAFKAFPNADYGVGLESGLVKFGNRYFDILFCCLYDGCEESLGSSMGFPLPKAIVGKIINNRNTLGSVASKLSGVKKIGEKGGAIHFLSRGLLSRQSMVEQAFLCALVERFSPI